MLLARSVEREQNNPDVDTAAVQTFFGTTAVDIGLEILAVIAFGVIGRRLIGKGIWLMQASMAATALPRC